MKNIILGIGMFCMVVITTMCCMTMSGRAARKNEMDRALDTAIEQTVNELQEENTYSLDSQDEFLADFIQGLLLKVKSDSVVRVEVAGVNQEKGLLSVKVQEHFKHPNGKPGSVEAKRTVILENYSLAKKKTFTITYKIGDTDYKVYTLTEGNPLPVPAAPEGLAYWLNDAGEAVDPGSQVADADKIFFARIN